MVYWTRTLTGCCLALAHAKTIETATSNCRDKKRERTKEKSNLIICRAWPPTFTTDPLHSPGVLLVPDPLHSLLTPCILLAFSQCLIPYVHHWPPAFSWCSPSSWIGQEFTKAEYRHLRFSTAWAPALLIQFYSKSILVLHLNINSSGQRCGPKSGDNFAEYF